MWDSLGVKLSLASFILALTLVGCGGDDKGVSPASLESRLLPASAVPGFKVERNFSWDNPIDLVDQDFPCLRALRRHRPPRLEDAGFEAGVGERLVAAKGNPFDAPGASIDVVQFGSDDEARDALDYVRKEAQKQPTRLLTPRLHSRPMALASRSDRGFTSRTQAVRLEQ